MHKLHSFLLVALFAMAAGQAADVKGSADHPLFPTRMPGHSINRYDVLEFSSYKFAGPPNTVIEGKYTKISYYRDTDQPAPGGLGVRRNYENAIKAAGGEVVYTRGNDLVLRGIWQGKAVWAEVTAADTGRYYFLTIVERVPMVQVISAAQMGTAIDRDGFIPLDIQFDTNKAVIKPESAATITEIVGLMKSRAALRVGVEGHTDNVGSAEANKTLSLQRAQAVVAAIVAQGIDANRLVAAGFGQEMPIGDNRTEAGRAKNRRVELVKK